MVFRRILIVAVAALALSTLAIAAQAQSSAPASCYPPLSLVTTSLPQATAGASFNTTLAATGGQPPYVFSGTALPQGLSINSAGELSGTAPSAGTYPVNVAVTDSLKNTVSAQLALSVVTASSTPPPNSPPPSSKPVISSLAAAPSTITAGQHSSLTWKVSGQTKLTLNGVAGVASPAVESPDATTTYTLLASNSAGSVSKSVTVTVNPATPPAQPPPLPVIASLTATPSTITAGQSSSLTWSVSGQTKLALNGVAGVTSPAAESPDATTTYTLTASNSAGSVSKSVKVTVNPVTPPPPSSGPPTGTALTACGKLTSSGSYYLANDVSSSGTCFPIGANNITLNLNGHTITYGTGGGSAPTPAIAACASWYTGPNGWPPPATASCIGGGKNLTVYGGNIMQSANSASFSPVFWIGQGTTGGGYIHDLTASFQSVGSEFFYGEIDGGSFKIQNNIINDNVTNIQHPGQSPLNARALFQGYVIHTDEDRTGNPLPDDISGNTFNGSPQGGIVDGVVGSQIYNNAIKLTSSYSNDYGVLVMINNQNVHDNTITGRGRGLDGESSGFILNHNTVDVAEQANNSEYNGCEGGGTYGIRVKNYDWPNSTESGASPSTNFQITNNTITVPASVCAATGMDLTDMNSLVTGTISGNNFTATANTGGQVSAALSFNADSGADIAFQGNSFTAPICVYLGGGGDIAYGAFTIQSGQTWNCPAGPTVSAWDYTYQQNPSNPPILTIQDSVTNPTVACGTYSTATISIGSSFTTTCSRKGN